MSKITSWEDYVKATDETAIYPHSGTGDSIELAYLTLGLAGELAELVDKINGNCKRSAILAEAGDVYWYLARFDRVFVFPRFVDSLPSFSENDLLEAEHIACRMGNDVKKALRDGPISSLPVKAAHRIKFLITSALLQFLDHASGESVEERIITNVLQPNLNKLKDRQQRGVIKGSGDYR